MDRLQRDRDRLTVRAPHAGLLLHGAVDAAPAKSSLRRGARVAASSVVLTVARPGRYSVTTSVLESDLFRARTGKPARVQIVALPELRLTGAIRVDLLPTSRQGEANVYAASVAVEVDDPRLRPGMGCKVDVILGEARDAVLVPKSAVFDKDGGKFVRCSKSKEGPFADRRVDVGLDDGKDIVIRDGVEVGEFVVPRGASK